MAHGVIMSGAMALVHGLSGSEGCMGKFTDARMVYKA